MHKADLIITKRLLGALLIALGALAFVGIILLDALRGTLGDFGPAQLLALAGSLGVCSGRAELAAAGRASRMIGALEAVQRTPRALLMAQQALARGSPCC
jgi:hypothetical protein